MDENINEDKLNQTDERLSTFTNNNMDILRIGDCAPSFTADSTFGKISLSDFNSKWLVFFCHPRRFYTNMYYGNNCFCKIIP